MKLKFKIVSSDYCSDVNTEAGGEATCSISIFKFTYLQREKKKYLCDGIAMILKRKKKDKVLSKTDYEEILKK